MHPVNGGSRSRFDPEAIRANYQTAENVASRFALYGERFAEPYVDIDQKMIDALALTGLETIIDRGTSNGRFLRLLREKHNHRGILIGVEPNIGQLYSSGDMLRWSQDKSLSAHTFFVQADAERFPFDEQAADVILDRFMLYHVAPLEQPTAIENARRSLKPAGRYVVATSGPANKFRHRSFEDIKAHRLGLQAPPFMIEGFDSNKAYEVLPEHFPYVYHFPQQSRMIIRDSDPDMDEKIAEYMQSIRSLNDQYEPPIIKDTFETELADKLIEYAIREEIRNRGSFSDYIFRDVFICSDEPPISHKAIADFRDISRSQTQRQA